MISQGKTLKIDIIKEFDSVDWSFVLNALKPLGFPSVFINCIEECESTPKFSVQINGI